VSAAAEQPIRDGQSQPRIDVQDADADHRTREQRPLPPDLAA
jgi:hypothetical protein